MQHPVNPLMQELLPHDGVILCCVSGGGDSMCLLHGLMALNYPVWVAHFNHQIRGEDSDRDQAFVMQWCTSHQIPYTIGSDNVPQRAKEEGCGIEEMARTLRYAFFQEQASILSATAIATAHNADDNAETLLHHLIRGTGLHGLGGIPPKRDLIIRPLLHTPRSAIDAYLAHHNIPYVQDSTNFDVTYTRNRIRHQILPLLRELNPNVVASLCDTAESLRQDYKYLQQEAQGVLEEAHNPSNPLAIQAAVLADQPTSIAREMARQLLANIGMLQVSASHIKGLVALAQSKNPSATLFLPCGWLARRNYTLLEFLLPKETSWTPCPLNLQGDTVVSSWIFHCSKTTRPPHPISDGTNIFYLSTAVPPPILRPRQVGDWISLPRRKTKSLKKLFIDEKLPRHQRDTLPLVVCQDQVVFIPNFGGHAPFQASIGESSWCIQVHSLQDNNETCSISKNR